MDRLLSVVRARAASRGLSGLDVRAAFLDHCAPSLPQVLGSVDACVVVPLLLTAAYHSKTDIPAQLAAGAPACPDIRLSGTLGPHPLLIAALERRLREAGDFTPAGTNVVLAAAGSSDPAANASVAALAARMEAAGGWRRVVPAYASAAGPRPDEAVRALRHDGPVVVASYLLAPGYFADKVRGAALAAGAAGVSGVLGDAPEIAGVILDRYQAAVRAELSVPRAARALYIPNGPVVSAQS